MARFIPWVPMIVALLPLSVANLLIAAQPSAELLPGSTKGYLSIPDLDQLQAKWHETQLGQLVSDPTMEPFVEDLRRQISSRFDQAKTRLGIRWEDLENAYGGEICMALVQPWDRAESEQAIAASLNKTVAAAKSAGRSEKQIAALRVKAERSARQEQERKRVSQKGIVVLVDVTGRETEADDLLEKIRQNLIARGGTQGSATISGVTMVRFTFPKKVDETFQREAYYGIYQDQLIASDHRAVVNAILDRSNGEAAETALAHLPAFKTAMSHCGQAMGASEPHIRWFIEPFGFMEVGRAYNGGRKRRGMDLLKVLANQGFAAVQGVGGLIAMSTDDHEILHRSFAYAPPVEREPGDPRQGKYNLAANMLDFPNTPLPRPPSWVPAGVATYLTLTWRMQQAFEHASTLVDEIAGDEIFEDVLTSIETDPNGPQINIRKDLVAHLAERATLIADYREPITSESERILFALELIDPPAVMRTINKAMESDPAAKKRTHHDHVIWEILNEDPVEVEALRIDDPAFGFGFDEPEPIEEEEPFMPNSAITVAHGQLLMASHVDFIVDILDQSPDAIGLDGAGDFRRVQQALDLLGAGEDSFRFFTRTERAYHPTYELIRLGKMPESETMLGKLLNRIWGSEETDSVRRQFIDGTNMPSFDSVRGYLGPAGTFIHTQEDGWAISGCLLKRD